MLESKLLAGALAGGYFVISGLAMLVMTNAWPDKWKSVTWYALFVHVFAVSIPMLASRFAHMTETFDEVRIFGIAGPVFHQISSGTFGLLIAGTVIDLLRSWRAAKGATHTS
ncbi:MAG: hypothetical protein JO283_11255 [Bradyrhizobium sp.]|nr:hypothetical protein [Bradyrhizobium sp.]